MSNVSKSGSAGTTTVSVDRRSPEAVFSLLGDDVRVEILQALGETPTEAVPFAELHRRVDVRDSGQFNYHLGKLRDVFVHRTDDGYRLTHAGRGIVGAMHAGTYTANASVDEIPVEGSCLRCGGRIVAAYADEVATVECADCGDWRNELPFPPGSLDQYDPDELPAAFDRWMRHVFGGVVDGFCQLCAGRTRGTLVVDGDESEDGTEPAHVEYGCDRCGAASRASAPLLLLFHPAVQGFLHDQGVDLSRRPSWGIQDVLVPDVSVESTDPPRVTIRVDGERERLAAVVEADATISSVERLPKAE